MGAIVAFIISAPIGAWDFMSAVISALWDWFIMRPMVTLTILAAIVIVLISAVGMSKEEHEEVK
jgi:drug/metabolite transporter (DMT)-like permease